MCDSSLNPPIVAFASSRLSLCQAGNALRLPGLLGEIEAVAGTESAMAVAYAKGGALAYFPPLPGPDHWLTKAVGQAAALAIAEAIVPAKAGVELMGR